MRFALVVEDNPLLAETLYFALAQRGLRVKIAHRLQSALELIKTQSFVLAIVDRLLPDGDGLQLVEELNNSFYQTRILMLTTLSQTSEKTTGLKLGADDYLGKPFNHQELMLRVENLLAKQKIYAPQVVAFGNLTLFPEIGKLLINQRQVKLRPKETQILACLIYHQGLVVTDKILTDFVWGGEGKTPVHSSISVYIRRLRVFMGSESVHLRTIRGVGYCLS